MTLIWISMVYKISLIKAPALLVWIYLVFLEPRWGNVSCYLFTVMAICHSVPRRNILKRLRMDRFRCCDSIFAVINKIIFFYKSISFELCHRKTQPAFSLRTWTYWAVHCFWLPSVYNQNMGWWYGLNITENMVKNIGSIWFFIQNHVQSSVHIVYGLALQILFSIGMQKVNTNHSVMLTNKVLTSVWFCFCFLVIQHLHMCTELCYYFTVLCYSQNCPKNSVLY